VLEYWTNNDIGGGPLTKDLEINPQAKGLATPLSLMIEEAETNLIQYITSIANDKEDEYFDVWILETNTNMSKESVMLASLSVEEDTIDGI